MTSPIQIPMLRPDPIHENPGFNQEQQFSPLAHLLMAKGQLALEQEKFQNEVSQQKDKKAQLANANQVLSQLFQAQQTGTPGGLRSAIGGAVGPLTEAGAGPEATRLLGELPGLQQREQGQATQTALAQALQEFSGRDIRDPHAQGELLTHLAAIDVGAAQMVAEGLRGVQGDFSMTVGNDGRLYILDKKSGKVVGGPETGTKGVAPSKLKDQAALALQRVVDAQSLLSKDPDADIYPTAAAGAENIGQSGLAKALMGAAGAMGIGPGTPEALSQRLLTPHQQMYQRIMDNFLHTYIGLLTGGASGGRSVYLFNSMRNSFVPKAGQSDADVRGQAQKTLNDLKPYLVQMAQGKTVDLTNLPFFQESQAAVAGPAGDQGGAGIIPNPSDFLGGVPPSNP